MSAAPFDAASAMQITVETYDGAVDLYDKWSSTYDDTQKSWEVHFHAEVAATLKEFLLKADPERSIDKVKVLDAGSGTGIVGESLAALGFRGIDGIDCSLESLKIAEAKVVKGLETKVYNRLMGCNLELPLSMFEDNEFDVVVCAGTTSYINDFSILLNEWCRIIKKGGYVIFTHRTKIWDDDFAQARSMAAQLEEEKKWKQVYMSEPSPYMPNNPVEEERQKRIYHLVYEVL